MTNSKSKSESESETETEIEIEGSQPAQHWVIEQIRDLTSPGDPWTSRGHLRQEASKSSHEFDRDAVDAAIEALIESGDLIGWHGPIALADTERLREIIERERESEFTRKLLVGKCNQLLVERRRE